MAQPRRKPSDRPKRRYIVFEVASNGPIGMQQVESAILHACETFKDNGMKFVYDTWDPIHKQGIVRIQHLHARRLCEALVTITTIGNIETKVKTLGMSGILRQAKLKFMRDKTIKKENKRNYHHRV